MTHMGGIKWLLETFKKNIYIYIYIYAKLMSQTPKNVKFFLGSHFWSLFNKYAINMCSYYIQKPFIFKVTVTWNHSMLVAWPVFCLKYWKVTSISCHTKFHEYTILWVVTPCSIVYPGGITCTQIIFDLCTRVLKHDVGHHSHSVHYAVFQLLTSLFLAWEMRF
jgi:hypothetical protein